MKKTRFRQLIKLVTMLLPVLLVFVFINVTAAVRVYANWNDVPLSPGQTYNCSDAKQNTTVTINKAGNYYIKGKSNYVSIEVNCGGVNLYLENGLDLNCGMYTSIGQRASPIYIGEQGGTVKIISRKNAKIYLEGYLAPGIRKDDTKTSLVFETEDPNNPGTIEVQGGTYSAGIGSVIHVSSTLNPPCGNITFNSGKIIARATLNGAGIGGGWNTAVNGITINGGDITANGRHDGAGIGAGYWARAENISITGGTVLAESDHNRYGAAAIGGGGGATGGDAAGFGKNIYISGGKVTAYSYGEGAAIGGGKDASGKNIVISGGNVHAEVKPASNYPSVAAAAAIGGGGQNVASSDVKISGGIVYAKGGYGFPGIGSCGDNVHHAKVRVAISGGTVIASKGPSGKYDIGGSKFNDDVDVRITGGSVYAADIESVKNANGSTLHRVDVSFDGETGDGRKVSEAVFSDGSAYGMNDVCTYKGGKFFPWLPSSTVTLDHAKLGNDLYGGSIKCSDKSGTLYKATQITIIPLPGEAGSTEGSGFAFRGSKKLTVTKASAPQPGYEFKYYMLGSDASELADANGNFKPNKGNLTDAEGKWKSTASMETIYAYSEGVPYKVHFDPNIPDNASTQYTGEMSDQGFIFGLYDNLSPNQFVLPGYTFRGWALKPDTSAQDKIYTDKEAVKNLTTKKDGIVTMYAQWSPHKYIITFSDGLGEGGASQCHVYKQEVMFDSSANLSKYSDEAFGWTERSNPSAILHGWKGAGLGSFYDDSEEIYNYIEKDGSGNYKFDENGDPVGKTLTADWIEGEKIVVTITKDDEPQPDLGDYLFLVDEHGAEFRPLFTYADGKYTFDPGAADGLAEGQYELCFDTHTASPGGTTGPLEYVANSISISYGGGYAVSTVFDYHEVSIQKDPAQTDEIQSVTITDKAGVIQPSDDLKLFVPDEHQVGIQTSVKEGYHFDGYSVLGVIPGNSTNDDEFDPGVANQTITVRGRAEITAHADANVYTVRFDGNNGSIVSGGMEDQDMVYDQPQHLFANRFECIGGTFKEWNTEKDGSGTGFADGQEVSNLTTEDGGVIMLYAQWNMDEYTITYDLDGGELPGDAFNPVKYTAATPAFSLIPPEKEDYEFMGWIGTDCPVPAKDLTISEGTTGNREYSAAWRILSFTVSFDSKGGSSVEPQNVLIHSNVQKPDDPVLTGYDFAGWFIDDACTQEYNFTDEVLQDLTLHAKWTPVTYKVRFSANGGSGTMDDQTISYDTAAELTQNVFKRAGYEFSGWNTKADGSGTSYEDKASVKNLAAINGSTVTLYAQWKALSWKVTYHDPDGINEDLTQTVFYDSDDTFRTEAELKGAGWSINKHLHGWTGENLGSFYAPGQRISAVLDENGKPLDQTVKALWTGEGSIHITVTTDSIGQEIDPKDIVLTQGGVTYAAPFKPVAGAKGVYLFDEETAGGKLPEGSYTVTLKDFPVMGLEESFIYDGSSAVSVVLEAFSVEVLDGYHTAASITETDPMNEIEDGHKTVVPAGARVSIKALPGEGYSFEQWTLAGTVPGEFKYNKAEQTVTIGGTLQLTAQSALSVYHLRFDLAGGTLDGQTGMVEVAANYGDTIVLPKPTREGYTFSYWKGSRYEAGASYTVRDDHTFTAQWKKDGGSGGDGDSSGDNSGSGGARTGDDNHIVLWLVMLSLAAATLIGIGLKRVNK